MWNVDKLPVGPGLIKRFGRLDINFDDPRFDNRLVRVFPRAHAATHEDGGTDELTLAQAQITGLSTTLTDLQDQIDALGSGGGGGGLVLIDSDTFSTASSVSLPNGSFDSTYDDYFMRVTGLVGSSDNLQMLCNLRASGSDITAANYDYTWALDYNSGGAIEAAGVDVTAWKIGRAASAGPGTLIFDVTSPALSEWTVFETHGSNRISPNVIHDRSGGVYKATTAADALTFAPASGTITGRWALYGYAK